MIERKIASQLSHRTQQSPQRPYHKLPREIACDILGKEHFTQRYPETSPGEAVSQDMFEGLWATAPTGP